MTRLFVVLWICTAVGCQATDRRTLDVFAASSLTEAFTDLERAFEQQHPEVDVRMTFSGSQVLRIQIEHGATPDLFASADEEHLLALEQLGLVRGIRAFATNDLVVITPLDSRLERFGDLANVERIVVGTPEVPVGAYTAQILRRASAVFGESFTNSVNQSVVSRENNVRFVRAKVELGEADAAVVYRTDAASSSAVRMVEIPTQLNVRATYAIGQLSPRSPDALAFLEFVGSERAAAALTVRGFKRPEP